MTDPEARQVTGAQSLILALEEAGVDTVFGIPGGAILPAYDPLLDSTKIRHILVRHEQGAGHAAQGYAVATGRVGVCMATSGPGATNLVTPLADAYMDSVPDRRDHRPGRRAPRSAPTPSRRRTSAASRCRSPSTTTSSPTRPRSRARSPRRSTSPRPGVPVRCSSTSPRTRSQAMTEFVVPRDRDPRRLPARHQAARQAGARGRAADRRVRAPGAVRRRRGHPGRGARGAAHPGRAHPDPGGHDADGAGRLPGQPCAAPRHARHARHGRRRRGAAAQRPADLARSPLRRPGDRPARHVRPGREGRSTPTSTRPRSPRTGMPTSRSSATAAR